MLTHVVECGLDGFYHFFDYSSTVDDVDCRLDKVDAVVKVDPNSMSSVDCKMSLAIGRC